MGTQHDLAPPMAFQVLEVCNRLKCSCRGQIEGHTTIGSGGKGRANASQKLSHSKPALTMHWT